MRQTQLNSPAAILNAGFTPISGKTPEEAFWTGGRTPSIAVRSGRSAMNQWRYDEGRAACSTAFTWMRVVSRSGSG
jgi:hypothetical protein